MEQIHQHHHPQQQQRMIHTKSTSGPISTYHPGHQQIISARTRSMPYPSPSMYSHSPGSVCQCTSICTLSISTSNVLSISTNFLSTKIC